MWKRGLLAFLAVAAASVMTVLPSASGQTTAKSARALTTVKVATGFRPDVLFTPFYVAQDLGYYKQAGLDVQMNYDRVSNVMQLVSNGTYTFATGGGDAAVMGAAAGAQVRYVMAQYEKYPVGAMTLKNGGPNLTNPSQLKGLNVGISVPGSSTDYGLTALLKAGKLSRSDVKVTAIGFTETEALINHQIDVAMTFIDNEPVQADALGHPVNVMPVSKYVNLVGSGVVTGKRTADKHGKLVTNFVRATLKGLKYTLAHQDAAFKIALKRMPDLVDQQQIAIARKVLTARLQFQKPLKGHPLGWSDPKAWAATTSFLKTAGVITTQVNAPTVFTNGFVNRVNVKP